MNLDKAISILTLMGTPEFNCHTEDILAARNLGIEALKRVQEDEYRGTEVPRPLLPGETED